MVVSISARAASEALILSIWFDKDVFTAGNIGMVPYTAREMVSPSEFIVSLIDLKESCRSRENSTPGCSRRNSEAFDKVGRGIVLHVQENYGIRF